MPERTTKSPLNGTVENLSAQIGDADPAIFTMAKPYLAGTLKVVVDGIFKIPGAGNDYQETNPSAGIFTFEIGSIPIAGQTVIAFS